MKTSTKISPDLSAKLPFDPTKHKRELTKFYLSLTDNERDEMLSKLSLGKVEDLFEHISNEILFPTFDTLPPALEYEELVNHLTQVASNNQIKRSLLGDGLPHYQIPELVEEVANNRGLSTAYTPYQPERSQGTLMSLWLYSSLLSALTGFEAVNASLYDRSTALFEALSSATKMVRGKMSVLVCETIYPSDLEVIETLAQGRAIKIITIPANQERGVTCLESARKLVEEHQGELAAIAFPQVNSMGNLEDVNGMTDLASEFKLKSIAVIDPILLGSGGLLPPSQYGSNENGCDMFIAEGQHLALGPNFGGPGLGIFGVRYNQSDRNSIRSTAGRYVGKGVDVQGREALCMVLSTREQHIRRERASSNICSNQAFIATLAGAAILARGEEGMSEAATKGHRLAADFARKLVKIPGATLAFPDTPFYNELVIRLSTNANELIKVASKSGLHAGVAIGERTGNLGDLMVCFTDRNSPQDSAELLKIITDLNLPGESTTTEPPIPSVNLLRKHAVKLPSISHHGLSEYYQKLGELNVSPDDFIYPLGSCTMKYNPLINDYLAALPGFTDLHPKAPIEDSQGALEILFQSQELFKAITGLAAVTTQPVAGAQGELVGLKLFQAYHRANDEEKQRNLILIPRSAHGTNPATATMAGFEAYRENGKQVGGIITIDANESGQIDMSQLREVVAKNASNLAGVMVTNPNTSGIFESDFKQMSELIHQAGGLVYMDGANMNAIAGWVDLNRLGVDAVHNNLHKTWSISHGGGGPGDAIVAVSERLIPFLPGVQIEFDSQKQLYYPVKPKKSIGSFHRHYGNFAHKVRCYSYLRALGSEGVRQMSAISVLSARYLYQQLADSYPTLPKGTEKIERMHEFIITLTDQEFKKIELGGTPKNQAIAKVGKLFLDFGLHSPTVAFPEVLGMMIEPTESFDKSELDRFTEIMHEIDFLINHHPEVLTTAPHFTPVAKVDEVAANKELVLSEKIGDQLPALPKNRISPVELAKITPSKIKQLILAHHAQAKGAGVK
jgi:glycine dehydrogenase